MKMVVISTKCIELECTYFIAVTYVADYYWFSIYQLTLNLVLKSVIKIHIGSNYNPFLDPGFKNIDID